MYAELTAVFPGHAEWDNDVCFEEGFDITAVEPGDVELSGLYDKAMVSCLRFLD